MLRSIILKKYYRLNEGVETQSEVGRQLVEKAVRRWAWSVFKWQRESDSGNLMDFSVCGKYFGRRHRHLWDCGLR